MITSLQNRLIKEIHKAARRGSLTTEGFALAEGYRLVGEAIRSGCEIAAVLVARSAEAAATERLPQLGSGVNRVVVADNIMEKISATEHTQGVLALVRPPRWQLADLFAARGPVVVLDGIREPGNAGAIVRVAEAFGAGGCVFLKGTVDPYNPKTIRASAGSVFRLPLVAGLDPAEVVHAARQRDLPLAVATPRGGQPVSEAELGDRFLLVLGNEAHGPQAGVISSARPLTVPTQGVESLNVAVAAGVILYEAWRHRQARRRGTA